MPTGRAGNPSGTVLAATVDGRPDCASSPPWSDPSDPETETPAVPRNLRTESRNEPTTKATVTRASTDQFTDPATGVVDAQFTEVAAPHRGSGRARRPAHRGVAGRPGGA